MYFVILMPWLRGKSKRLLLRSNFRANRRANSLSLRTALLHDSTSPLHETCFVGIGGEVLTEIGMDIKSGSPYKHTFVITHCNGEAGYLGPAHLYVQGGYEIKSSPFAPQASKMVVKKTVAMLHEL